jgi:hypothetical protein
MKAIQDIATGFAISITVLGTLAVPGCGGALPPKAVAAARLAECKLEAVRVLPADPGMITPYDLADVVERLQACRKAQQQADSGAP